MICYKDKTFCPFYKACKESKQCGRALTDDVIKAAHAWWGSDEAPICVYGEKPDCFKEKKCK